VSVLGGVKISLHALKSVDLLGIHVLRISFRKGSKVVVFVASEHVSSLVCKRDHFC
jgi:hypothetical protein